MTKLWLLTAAALALAAPARAGSIQVADFGQTSTQMM